MYLWWHSLSLDDCLPLPSCPPEAAFQELLQFPHVPVALSLSSLLVYIKHLAVSRRRALRAGWPRSEVTVQESCILKGLCKKSWVSPERIGRRAA